MEPCSLVAVDRSFKSNYCLQLFTLMMKAVRASETSAYFYKTTRLHLPDDCRRYSPCENLEFHQFLTPFLFHIKIFT
jgi:hypothetical protein